MFDEKSWMKKVDIAQLTRNNNFLQRAEIFHIQFLILTKKKYH